MKQYTHAWLAFKAIERLEKAKLSNLYKRSAEQLITWFNNNRDGVMQGAWYPDAVIKDMASSHIIKYMPDAEGSKRFRKLPTTYHLRQMGWKSEFYLKGYAIGKGNLPDRCEALAHSIIDNLKMQESEEKGCAISPTDNHVATIFFMLSHYIADAHMPLHCDARSFSSGANIHAYIEEKWDHAVKECYDIDAPNERFLYNTRGYPLRKKDTPNAVIDWIDAELGKRKYISGWGAGNGNTWDFMSAICQYSYLTSYLMIPKEYDKNNLTKAKFNALTNTPHGASNDSYSMEEYSKYLLIDSIDSIARVWLRVWNKYRKWMER